MTIPSARFLSYSVNNEDVILNRIFGKQDSGFFVDVGAAHPLFENDTRALYERGWCGINIEPDFDFFRALTEERPRDTNLNLAVSDEAGEITFHKVLGTGLSTCDPDGAARAKAKGFEVVRHTLRAVTLREILAGSRSFGIDLLKVDVEGFELKVLASNDWGRFRPKIILAEGTYPESPLRRDDGVAGYLAAQGYRHVYFDGLNDFYAEQSFSLDPEIFDRPVNLFDNFVPLAQNLAERANVELELQLDALRQERKDAGIYIDSLKTELDKTGKQLRRTEILAQSQAIDLERAYTELVAMRERGKALVATMEASGTGDLPSDRISEPYPTPSTEGLASEIARIYASTSWRLTRPLRALKRPRRTLQILLGRPVK
jgi:FkbM family methyltransferase